MVTKDRQRDSRLLSLSHCATDNTIRSIWTNTKSSVVILLLKSTMTKHDLPLTATAAHSYEIKRSRIIPAIFSLRSHVFSFFSPSLICLGTSTPCLACILRPRSVHWRHRSRSPTKHSATSTNFTPPSDTTRCKEIDDRRSLN